MLKYKANSSVSIIY